MVGSKPKNAFIAGSMVVALWAQHADFGQVFIAYLLDACPYLIPKYHQRPSNASGLLIWYNISKFRWNLSNLTVYNNIFEMFCMKKLMDVHQSFVGILKAGKLSSLVSPIICGRGIEFECLNIRPFRKFLAF